METVKCRTPTPGKSAKNIARGKFDAVRRAILASLPKSGQGVLFTDLTGLVEKKLTVDERNELGSVMWYVTTVKLELEVRGEIHRVEGAVPQRLVRSR